MNLIINFLILLIIFLTPLLGTVGNSGYEQSKVLFFIFTTTTTTIIWLFQSARKKEKFRLNFIQRVQVLFILTLVITSFTGINLINSLLGAQPYFQGCLLYIYFFLFSILVSQTKIRLEHIAFALTSSALVVSSIALEDWLLFHFLHRLIPNYVGRVVSTFGQPNFFAGFLLMSLPFTYSLLSSNHRQIKAWSVIGLFLAVTAILISQSKAAIILLVCLLLIWLFSKLKHFKKIMAGFFVILITLSMFLSFYFSSGFFWKEFTSRNLQNNPDLTSDSVEKRPYIWLVSLKVIAQKPITGYGVENISNAYLWYFTKFKHQLFEENLKVSSVLISLKDLNIDRTHNYFLDLLLFTGIFGLMSWLLLDYLLIKKTKDPLLIICLLIYFVWIQFQNQSVVNLIYFWTIAGLIGRTSNDA